MQSVKVRSRQSRVSPILYGCCPDKKARHTEEMKSKEGGNDKGEEFLGQRPLADTSSWEAGKAPLLGFRESMVLLGS